jgi:hypothetical protein
LGLQNAGPSHSNQERRDVGKTLAVDRRQVDLDGQVQEQIHLARLEDARHGRSLPHEPMSQERWVRALGHRRRCGPGHSYRATA